jgi:hypothetical protein
MRHDQQNKEKAASQIHNANQLNGNTKKDAVKKVLALFNDSKSQAPNELDDEFSRLTLTKTAMVCKLTQITPDIWVTLPLEAKKWLLNERKRHQFEDEKAKKAATIGDKNSVKFSDEDPKDVNMPNQYAKVKSIAKGEEIIQEDTEQPYEFLEEVLRSSGLFETEHDLEYDHLSSDHNIHASISISITLHNKCMNLLFLPEIYHISILDDDADTCVLGKGWEIISIHISRKSNVVEFDHEAAVKRNLPIVSAITAIDLPDGTSILLVIHECIIKQLIIHCYQNSNYENLEFKLIQNVTDMEDSTNDDRGRK